MHGATVESDILRRFRSTLEKLLDQTPTVSTELDNPRRPETNVVPALVVNASTTCPPARVVYLPSFRKVDTKLGSVVKSFLVYEPFKM